MCVWRSIQFFDVDAQPDGLPKNGTSGQGLAKIVVRCRQGLSKTESLIGGFVTELRLGAAPLSFPRDMILQARAQLFLVLEEFERFACFIKHFPQDCALDWPLPCMPFRQVLSVPLALRLLWLTLL